MMQSEYREPDLCEGRSLAAGLSATVELMTPERAGELLENAAYEYQRGRSETHIDELCHAILGLQWEPTAIHLYRHSGRDYLVDGQHRLAAIVKAGMPAPLIIIRREADSINQVMDAYRRLDINLGRSPKVGLMGSGVHTSAGLGGAELGKMIAALKILMNGFQNSTAVGNRWKYRNRDTLTKGVYQWQEEARLYFRATDQAATMHRKRMLSGPVLAVALVTYRYRQEQAESFWARVAKRERLDGHSGEWHAADVLASEEMRYVARVTRRLAGAWNAYYEGRQPIRVIATEGGPIRILGTPYVNGRIIREEFD